MNRRNFFLTSASAAIAGSARAADPAATAIIELRRIQLRNSPDNQRQRNNEFLREQSAALARASAGPVGAFSSTIAPNGPFLLTLVSYPSFAAIEQVQSKLAADAAYQKALDTFNGQPGLNYERIES